MENIVTISLEKYEELTSYKRTMENGGIITRHCEGYNFFTRSRGILYIETKAGVNDVFEDVCSQNRQLSKKNDELQLKVSELEFELKTEKSKSKANLTNCKSKWWF